MRSVEIELIAVVWNLFCNSFLITCSKVEPGRHFEGLELLSQLMRPPGRRGVAAPPSITTVSSSDVDLVRVFFRRHSSRSRWFDAPFTH